MTQEAAFRQGIGAVQETVGIPLASRVVQPAIQSALFYPRMPGAWPTMNNHDSAIRA